MDLQKSSKMLILSTKIPNLHYFCHSKNVPYKRALLFKWLLNPSFMQKKHIIVMNQFWENGFTNSLSKIPVLISFMSFYGDFPKFSCKLCNKSSIKMQNIVQFSDVFRAFGRPVSRFGCPNSVAKKQFSSFLFLVVFLQKILWSSFQWFKNASNYFKIA